MELSPVLSLLLFLLSSLSSPLSTNTTRDDPERGGIRIETDDTEEATIPPPTRRKHPRTTTVHPFQDYPDYELPVKTNWPPPQEGYPPPRQDGYPPPRQEGYPPPRQEGYPPPRPYAPLPPDSGEYQPERTRPRIPRRRPNDYWVRTNGAYPELINLRSLGNNLAAIGLPPIDQPAVPVIPIDNFPPVPYPNLGGYPEQEYGSYPPQGYRSRPPSQRPNPHLGNRYGGDGDGYRIPDYPVIPSRTRVGSEYGNGRNGNTRTYGSYPPIAPPREFRQIPSPYGYSYAGYIERQSRMYPIMLYTLENCPSCQSAKRLLAVNYADVPSHFLELVGDEEWQHQLHIDLQNLTNAGRFPYIFICGQYIGGAGDLHEMHRRGQIRAMLAHCQQRPYKEKQWRFH